MILLPFTVSVDIHPTTLFKVTQALLGKEDSEVYLQDHVEEFSEHLLDKITQIHSQLNTNFNTGPMEMPGIQSCLVIWEWF